MARKNDKARPRKSPNEGGPLQVWVTKPEERTIRGAALKAKKSLSNYLRALLGLPALSRGRPENT